MKYMSTPLSQIFRRGFLTTLSKSVISGAFRISKGGKFLVATSAHTRVGGGQTKFSNFLFNVKNNSP